MSKKNQKIFSNNEERKTALENFFSTYTKREDFRAVWISGNDILPRNIECSPSRTKTPKILLVFEGLPVKPDNLAAWREWAKSKGAFDIKVIFYDERQVDNIETFLNNRLGDWLKPQPAKEETEIKKRQWVEISGSKEQKGDPSLLTLMFGKTGEMLSHLDWVKARFGKAYNIEETKSKKYLESISERLKNPHLKKHPALDVEVEKNLDLIPRILLSGETGVGKTLFARYLAGKGKLIRISIPEYLEKEDMFEYDLFGYVAGAYTGGREEGSLGVLLENMGGVIFLDEIGEASQIIQTKLLAFLDDYKVRPRGWNGDGFYCPVLIVGATNQDMEAEGGKYRNDLLQRFTDKQTIPPLRDRMENFHLLLDCLLQNRGINIDGIIQEIGKKAFELLDENRFEKGNFRELENLMRNACRKAAMDGRDYLVRQDFE